MAVGFDAIIVHLIKDFLGAVASKDIRKIRALDDDTRKLLSDPKFDKSKYRRPLSKLKEVHEQALGLVREEARAVSSRADSLSENQEGLRGYYEVLNQ